MISELPMSGDYLTHDLTIEGRPVKLGDRTRQCKLARSSVTIFLLWASRFFADATFSGQDREDTPVVVVVNETFVRKFFANQDPLGARIEWSRDKPGSWKTIVGVVGDVKHFGLDQPEEPAVYDLYSQMDEPWKRWMSLVVHSPRDPGELTRQVEAQIWALDRGIPPTAVLTMKDVMDASVTPRKFNLTLMMIFAAVALALAADRHLWSRGLFRHAAHSRNRCPCRSRRPAARHRSPRARRRSQARGSRCNSRTRCGRRAHALYGQLALWSHARATRSLSWPSPRFLFV